MENWRKLDKKCGKEIEAFQFTVSYCQSKTGQNLTVEYTQVSHLDFSSPSPCSSIASRHGWLGQCTEEASFLDLLSPQIRQGNNGINLCVQLLSTQIIAQWSVPCEFPVKIGTISCDIGILSIHLTSVKSRVVHFGVH